MGILRSDRITGLGGANAIKGSVLFSDKQYFLIDNHEDFQFGTGDWTIEYWWNGHPNGGYNSVITTMITSNESGTWRVGHTFSGNNRIYFARGYGGGFTDVTFDVDVNDNKWHHIAFVRSSGTIIPFVDGVDKTATKATGSVSDGNSMTTTNRVAIGWNDRDNDHIYGHVSNLRVIKGTALYTSNFTPPTAELQKLSGTSLLCFQSPSNILQEETGKILQPYRDGSSAGDQAGLNSTYAVATRFTPNTPVGFSTTTDVGSQYGTTFDGFTVFATSTYMVPPGGNTRERNRGRGVFAGGYAPSPASLRNIIDYVEIQSTGNAIDFGDLLSINNGEGGACSSSTRALFGGGQSNIVDITFITIANTSNVTDFGDLITGRRSLSAVSSDTKGLFAGGTTPAMKNEIESVTIATAGNASDFGDLTVARRNMAPNSSSTRGVFAGGNPGSSPLLDDTIDFVTIASAGNATDFGNLITAMREQGGSSSATRGLIAGGFTSPANLNTIEFITIATTGNASDFGDLHTAVSGLSGTSNGTRGIFAGGAYINNIQYVTIASTGNAEDFGDLTAARFLYDGTSDSHGGLS